MSKGKKSVKEPLIRLSKRNDIAAPKAWGFRAVALLLAFLTVGLFMYFVTGVGISETYATIYEGALGNKIYISSTLMFTAKLLCLSVALAPAFKMRFWNIGAEGQLLAGALATAIVMVYLGNSLPTWLLFIVMVVSSIAAGAACGLLPAVFKAKFNTNETLFTLMMNYVVIKLVDYFYDLWKGNASSLGKLNRGTKAGYLPDLFDIKWLFTVAVVLIIAVLMFFYLKKTKQGYEIAVVGESVSTANYAGINVNRVIIRTMIISGAVCGIAGFLTVSGKDHSISSVTTGGGYGFTAIIVAWLSKFNTLTMILVSFFIVVLERGTELIASRNEAFDSSASKIVIGIVLFFVIGAEFFINYKINFRKKNKEA